MIQEKLTIPCSAPEDLTPTRETGLTMDEVRARAQAGLDNRAPADPGKNVLQILCGNLFTPFNLLNVLLALCLALVRSYRNMLFLGVVVSNTVIGTVQELRAHRTIRRLTLLNAPRCHVLREGREQQCRAEELVRGDLVILRAGDQVPADAIVRSGEGAANESLLTGESDAIAKACGDWLLSGSYISEGRFTAQVHHVGETSYVNRLTRAARHIKQPKSALMHDLNRLIRLVSALLLPLGALLFCKQYFLQHAELSRAVTSSVAAMLGMIPEGLMLLTSIALAVGVVKLGRRRTLVQELYGIENLARADVLCLDKTGTLTTGEMCVHSLLPLDADEPGLRAALSRFLGAFEETPGAIAALRAQVRPGEETPVARLPFSSARKLSAASFGDGVTLILGAPTFVLRGTQWAEVRRRAEEYASQGLRVLALCEASGRIGKDSLPEATHALGLCILEDTLRPHCEDTLRYFRAQGVTLKVISGDDPRTAAAIARRAGLEGADAWADASTLTTADDVHRAALECAVIGRATPEQKRQLIEALKAAGHSVAMTGDGVNDIPALKAADCSIAMAGGSDAARHAAQFTLLDADFSVLPLVVDEGRRVINNITRAASLFLVKTLFSFALAVLLLALPGAYPFQPIQLTFISALTIGVPTFFLALEPNAERIRGQFLRNVITRALPSAAAVTVCACVCMMLEHAGWPQSLCSTLATLSTGCMGLITLLRVCLPFDRLRLALLCAMTAAFVLGAAVLRQVFFLDALGAAQLLVLLGLAALGLAVMLLTDYLLRGREAARGQGVQAAK